MDTDFEIVRSALQFVCGETEDICRLCLSPTKNENINLDEEVWVKRSYFDETISFVDMFIELGILLEPALPQVICKECANTVLNSYLFQKLYQYSSKTWREVLEKLETGLKDAETINPSTQTLYIVMNRSDNVLFTTRKSLKVKDKKNALAKIKNITRYKDKQYYIKYSKKHKTTANDSHFYFSANNDEDYIDNHDSNNDENVYSLCMKCGLSYKSDDMLRKHMKNSHSGRHACHKCGKVFGSKQQVKGHIERIHKPKKIKCPLCGKLFSTNSLLHNHHQMHHIAVNCKLCFVQFPSKYVLRQHLDKHEVNKCPKCKKSYINKNTFKFHLKICGNQEEKTPKFFCDLCSNSYVRKNGIRTHLKVDHGFGKVLSCSWCPKKFDAVSRLKMHIVKHTKERNFKCDVCGGVFVTQAALVYHNRLHTGEKPFPCDLCDERFLSASRRMEHKRRKHFGPSRECHICHMKFVMTHQLKKHVQRHYNPQSKLYVPNVDSQSYVVEPVLE